MPSKTGGPVTVPAHSGRKYVNIILLNEEELLLPVEPKSKVQDLFDQVCLLVGVKETQFFWLSVFRDGEHEFLDQKSKISKYAPKGWKTESLKVADKTCRSTFNIYFRVQLYVEHVSLIKDDVTRQNYYLQLKQNVLAAPVLCREEACFILASYALQADLGNYAEDTHRGRYFDPSKYFPEWVIKRRGEAYIVTHVPAMHRDQRATTRVYAQRAFIREASNTIEHVMHFYRLKKTKTEPTPSIWFGISTRGIQLYEDLCEGKYLLCEYPWCIIKRLTLQKRKFELQVEGVADGRKITYYTSSESKSKHLLRLCKLTHTFQMQTQPIVDAAKKRESATEKNKYRESYISGDMSFSDQDGSMTTMSIGEMTAALLEKQRQSVVSTVSSVTTSGIVSDEKSPMDRSASEVGDDYMFSSVHQLDSVLTLNPRKSLGPDASHHSSMSSGLGERAQPSKVHGGQLSNRHSAAVSETSSHRSAPDINPAFFGVWGDQQPMDVRESTSSASYSNRQSKNSELGWLSDDEARREAGSQSSGSRPTSRHLTLIDTQMIQAEIAGKEVDTPLLSALCNDRSLRLMQQQQQMQNSEDEEDEEDDDDETTTQDHGRYADLESWRSPSSQSSMHEVRASQDLNISVTTLVSHSSVDSDMHGSVAERLHGNSSAPVIQPHGEDYPAGPLTKHQTLNTLNDLPEGRRYEARLPFGDAAAGASAEGKFKCQTLPVKMNGSEQMLRMGRDSATIKEECVSFSAPNLSPGAVHNEVPIPLA